jgi:hypothetical protein
MAEFCDFYLPVFLFARPLAPPTAPGGRCERKPLILH